MKKLPTVKELQVEYAQVLEEKKKVYGEYRQLRNEIPCLKRIGAISPDKWFVAIHIATNHLSGSMFIYHSYSYILYPRSP